MPTIAPLLDLGTARLRVQEHVGEDMNVVACWQPPEAIYRTERDDDDFYFAVGEFECHYVGGTRHVAVDRRTGAIRELGCIGE